MTDRGNDPLDSQHDNESGSAAASPREEPVSNDESSEGMLVVFHIQPSGQQITDIFDPEASVARIKQQLQAAGAPVSAQSHFFVDDMELNNHHTLGSYRDQFPSPLTIVVNHPRSPSSSSSPTSDYQHQHQHLQLGSHHEELGARTSHAGNDAEEKQQTTEQNQMEEQKEKETETGYVMPDTIRVAVSVPNLDELPPDMTQENGQLYVVVKVIRENLQRPKPFLGGFRNKKTGAIYHHASCQTVRKNRIQAVTKFERETQTISTVTRSQQTSRETGTQMSRADLFVDESNDRVLVARPYMDAKTLDKIKEQKANSIQNFLRLCFAFRRVRQLQEQKDAAEQSKVSSTESAEASQASEHQRQIQRRMQPRTKQDFQLLFKELEAWRLHETQRIKLSGGSPEEIQAQLAELLAKEVKLLQTIDRLKLNAAKENKQMRTKETLEKMASPQEWSVAAGEDHVEVETPFTIRAKQLVELYSGLCLPSLPREQRVDVLLHVKQVVKEFDVELTREILSLIQREEDLLRRGRQEQSLAGLRKRLSNLFLQFIDTPEFNPEAANYKL